MVLAGSAAADHAWISRNWGQFADLSDVLDTHLPLQGVDQVRDDHQPEDCPPSRMGFSESTGSLWRLNRGDVAGSTQFEPRMDFHQDRLVRPAGDSVIRSGRLEMTRAIRRASSGVNPPDWCFVP
jgi:hypothetical protein